MKHHRSPFDIKRGGVEVTVIQDDPDGLPTYDRAFVFKGTGELQRLTIREAWDIAKFITRQLAEAQVLQAYKRLRKLAGFGNRPREP